MIKPLLGKIATTAGLTFVSFCVWRFCSRSIGPWIDAQADKWVNRHAS